MEHREFANKLSAWIPPNIISFVLNEDLSGASDISNEMEIPFESDVISSSKEVNLEFFVNLYLKGFYLPENLCKLLFFYYPSYCTNSNLSLLGNIKFTGKVEYYSNEKGEYRNYRLMKITSTKRELLLIRSPLLTLIKLLEDAIKFWKPISINEDLDSISHRSTEDRLHSFISLKTMEYFGFKDAGNSGLISDQYKIMSYKGYFHCYGPMPVTQEVKEAIIINKPRFTSEEYKYSKYYKE
ncbi:hypothetical protein [uncultured Dokdonia sp.]|uniref:hypothetical protein n=1 Tax=uncultured Dokdonia sp. TaxID=575653 RepID=UPI00261C426D|nr:hypothetical protein [uncultured Dokdonia sp.]